MAPGVIHALVDYFAVAPEFIGCCASLLDGGDGADAARLLTVELTSSTSPIGEPGTPVVVATRADMAKLGPSLVKAGPGAYAIGTGDTGVAKAIACLGVLYGAIGVIGSRCMRIPHPDWKCGQSTSDGNKVMDSSIGSAFVERSNDVGLTAHEATTSTRQFPLLWLSVFGNATGGLALLSSLKLYCRR